MALQKYFWTLPEPVLSPHDCAIALSSFPGPPSLAWNPWSEDPIKAAVLRALFSCQVRLGYGKLPYNDIAHALTQSWVRLLYSIYCKWRKYVTKIFSEPFQHRQLSLLIVQKA